MLEKTAWMNMLHDFYGELLTRRQKDYMELYYGHNLSLGEIAGEYMVTRQAVHDALKRAEQILSQYEEKLGLVEKFTVEKNKLAQAEAFLVEFARTGDGACVREARNILKEVLELAEE